MDKTKYPEYIMEYIRGNLGLDEDDTSQDDYISDMSADEAFSAVCTWNGFIGWEESIKSWVEVIYGIEFGAGE